MTAKSLMFVPAKEKMIAKIPVFNADGYIVDLEDSIESSEKQNALQCVIENLPSLDMTKIWIRINSDRAEIELNALKDFNVGYMLPKVSSAQQYEAYKDILQKHNVIALIESPLAIVNIHEISSCDYVDALAFGAEDYTASMNMENFEQNLIYPRSIILNYAKAFGKPAYDTPSFKINDIPAFEQEVQLARRMGYDGKLCINPKHLDFINESFKGADLEFIKSIVERYENDGNAVVVIDGVVYEKMHINRLKKILKENEVK